MSVVRLTLDAVADDEGATVSAAAKSALKARSPAATSQAGEVHCDGSKPLFSNTKPPPVYASTPARPHMPSPELFSGSFETVAKTTYCRPATTGTPPVSNAIGVKTGASPGGRC